MNLKLKYSLSASIIVALLIAAFSGVIYLKFKKRLLGAAEQALASHLEHESQHLFELSDDERAPSDFLHSGKNIHLQVWKDGKLISNTFPANVILRGRKSELHTEDNKLISHVKKSVDGHEYYLLGYFDLSSNFDSINELKKILVIGCVLALLIIAPLSWWLISVFLNPFARLSAQTSQLTAERLSFRFQEPSQKDEYGTLVSNFNELLERLQKAFDQVKRFAANASHEFRTPLAIIKGESQVMLRKPRSVEEYRSGYQTILSQTTLLQNIISRLLFFADLERAELEEKGTVLPGKVIEETVQAIRLVHSSRNVNIEVSVTDAPGQIAIHEELFVSTVNNLIENAVKYCRSKIQVRCKKAKDGILFQVDDDGPGIPMSERDEVFQTFYRMPNPDSALQEGHGLGLSIVKACVEAAQGKIALGDSPMGGLMVQVTLPA